MYRTQEQDLSEQDQAALDASIEGILADLLGDRPEEERKQISDAATHNAEGFAALVRKVCGF